MRIINVEFDVFDQVALSDLFRMTGVYVIWDRRAMARPTYIGEGSILRRLVHQSSRFDRPLLGYVAILGDAQNRTAKRVGQIVETLLLYVGDETDRHPTRNRAVGQGKAITAICRGHGTLRVNVQGFDPFTKPWQTRPLTRAKRIVLRDQGECRWKVEHDWRLRPLDVRRH